MDRLTPIDIYKLPFLPRFNLSLSHADRISMLNSFITTNEDCDSELTKNEVALASDIMTIISDVLCDTAITFAYMVFGQPCMSSLINIMRGIGIFTDNASLRTAVTTFIETIRTSSPWSKVQICCILLYMYNRFMPDGKRKDESFTILFNIIRHSGYVPYMTNIDSLILPENFTPIVLATIQAEEIHSKRLVMTKHCHCMYSQQVYKQEVENLIYLLNLQTQTINQLTTTRLESNGLQCQQSSHDPVNLSPTVTLNYDKFNIPQNIQSDISNIGETTRTRKGNKTEYQETIISSYDDNSPEDTAIVEEADKSSDKMSQADIIDYTDTKRHQQCIGKEKKKKHNQLDTQTVNNSRPGYTLVGSTVNLMEVDVISNRWQRDADKTIFFQCTADKCYRSEELMNEKNFKTHYVRHMDREFWYDCHENECKYKSYCRVKLQRHRIKDHEKNKPKQKRTRSQK